MAHSAADPVEAAVCMASVESIIHDRQDEYNATINRRNYEGESTAFIMFMLSAIKEGLTEAVQTTGAAEAMTTEELRWYKIERFFEKEWHDYQRRCAPDVQRIFRNAESYSCEVCR